MVKGSLFLNDERMRFARRFFCRYHQQHPDYCRSFILLRCQCFVAPDQGFLVMPNVRSSLFQLSGGQYISGSLLCPNRGKGRYRVLTIRAGLKTPSQIPDVASSGRYSLGLEKNLDLSQAPVSLPLYPDKQILHRDILSSLFLVFD